MKLSAGITELTTSWESALNQLGLPIQKLSPGFFFEPDEIPLIILTKKSSDYKDALIHYLKNGGTVLTEADTASGMLGIRVKPARIRYILSRNDDIFKTEGICDINRICLVAADANHLESDKGIKTILSMRMYKGMVIVLPSGFISLLNDFRITRKNFYSPYGKKETNERVASVSKGMISHIIRNALEYLYHSRGLPFVSLWHFPSGSENVFSFRIDTDFGSRESINELYNIVKNRNLKATWFIETVSAEKSLDDFKKFNSQEIALHCYRHKVFSTYWKNSEQIRKALSILKHNDISTKGFAAPYGQWNRNLGRVITDMEFCYSSEFGFVYDSLPLFPAIKKDTYTSLQIPVHPVSLGRLHWGGHNSAQMLQYFQNIFAQKASLYDPVIIYAHPADLKFNIWDKILDSGLSYNFTNLTLREYAAWWKKRGSLTWEASYDGNNTNIITGNKDKSFWVSILTPQNEMILKPLSGKPSVEKKLHEPVFKLNNLFSAASLREKTKRMFYHDLLSHYRKLKQ